MLKRQSTGEVIADELLLRILGGTLKAGERLREMVLAREFGTSQAPVRDALRDLERRGFVEIRPYKGARVREVGAEEMCHAYQARGILEEAAAVLACRDGSHNWTSTIEAARQVGIAAKARDPVGYSEHDYQMHRSIVEAAGNPVLLQLWMSLAPLVRTQHFLSSNDEMLDHYTEEHDEIIAALKAGDGMLAGQLLRSHADGIGAATLIDRED